MNDSKFKIYYFFSYGEIIESVETTSKEKAIKEFKKVGYSDNDFDFILEYNHNSYIPVHL